MEECHRHDEQRAKSKQTLAVVTVLLSMLLVALMATRAGFPSVLQNQGTENDSMDRRYEETVFPTYKYPTDLLTSATKHEALLSYAKIKTPKAGQSLYIPAMYNPMVDPNKEIMDMIEQFQDVVKQLDELERQLKCAANCTANQSSAFAGNGSFELDYELTFSNGSASFGSHNSSEEVDTCLRNCSMEPIVFRTAEEAEVLISSKMAQLRILEGSLRGKLASTRTWLATRTRHRRQQMKGGAANRAGKTRGQDVARARVLDKWLREDRSKQ